MRHIGGVNQPKWDIKGSGLLVGALGDKLADGKSCPPQTGTDSLKRRPSSEAVHLELWD